MSNNPSEPVPGEACPAFDYPVKQGENLIVHMP
jgi:hypothetical protein